MFYISSKNGDNLGVTDTADNVEEFYTKAQLANFFRNNNIRINGFTYTGSSFKVEVKNPALIFIENLQNGDVFILDGKPAMRVGETGLRDFNIFRDDSVIKVSRKNLLRGDYKVSDKAVSDTDRKALISRYLKLYPSTHLSMFLVTN